MEIIAEIGLNHNGSMTLAKELVAAKENGADVAKFQIFNAKKLFNKKVTDGTKIIYRLN